MPSTSTVLTFLPTTSRSRSRRTTSTSGSSGIPAPRPGPAHHGRGSRRAFVLQTAPRAARGCLLGRLLRAALALAVHLAAQLHAGEELARVIGALGSDLVAREGVAPLGCQLLEPGLEVAAARAERLLADVGLQQLEDHAGRGVEPTVEVDGGEHRLHRVGE